MNTAHTLTDQNSEIPSTLRANIRNLLGEVDGDQWLLDAMALARVLSLRWSIEPLEVLAGGAMSLCLRCRDQHGVITVLKVPSRREDGLAEIAALSRWRGRGVPGVWRRDDASGAFLMEFVRKSSWRPSIPSVELLLYQLHAGGAGDGGQPLSANINARRPPPGLRFASPGDVRRAGAELDELLDTTSQMTSLHGDFQAKNVIHGHSGPIAIDPLPCIGDPLFDIALWIATGSSGEREAALMNISLPTDLSRLTRWTWALSVYEYRTGSLSAHDAKQFIDAHRPEPCEAARAA